MHSTKCYQHHHEKQILRFQISIADDSRLTANFRLAIESIFFLFRWLLPWYKTIVNCCRALMSTHVVWWTSNKSCPFDSSGNQNLKKKNMNVVFQMSFLMYSPKVLENRLGSSRCVYFPYNLHEENVGQCQGLAIFDSCSRFQALPIVAAMAGWDP